MAKRDREMPARSPSAAAAFGDDLRRLPAAARAFIEAIRLKQLFRRGWLLRGLPEARTESVADHVFGVALLALLLAENEPEPLDRGKVLRMAILHDLGEIDAGDLTPADGVGETDKIETERASVRRLLADLPGGEGHLAVWEEYVAGESAEARFVRRVDRLEMALQAAAYGRLDGLPTGEFLASARTTLAGSELESILDVLEEWHPPENGC